MTVVEELAVAEDVILYIPYTCLNCRQCVNELRESEGVSLCESLG